MKILYGVMAQFSAKFPAVTHSHKVGGWQAWLERNFSLSQQTATNFMNCAVRFSNVASMQGLNSTQMIQLLSLPDAEETEKFIAEKAAEGKAVAATSNNKNNANVVNGEK